jgi:hypothetical protein
VEEPNGDSDPGPIDTDTVIKSPPEPTPDPGDPGPIETRRLWEGQRDEPSDGE